MKQRETDSGRRFDSAHLHQKHISEPVTTAGFKWSEYYQLLCF